MNNPSIQLVTVTDTPTLIFSGCGKVQIDRLPPNTSTVSIGDASVAFGSPDHSWALLPNSVFKEKFEADVELYGITSSGTTQVVRVTRWF